MHPSSLAKRGTVFLFLAVIAFYFYGLGHFPLLGPDEPRYAEVVREMLLRGDLISPTLGGHLWFEKPALLYWMMIGSFKLFGVTEWAARLPAALAGLLTIAAVYVVARQTTGSDEDFEPPQYAFWSVLASATTLGIIVFSRAASFDIILTMTIAWALAFYLLQEFALNEKRRAWCLAGCYIFIGLSLLAKGLVGIILPGGIIAVYCLFQRKLPQRGVSLSLLWGLPLALIVAAAWYVPVIRQHGWLFIDQFFIQHHFARYLSNKYHHRAAFYYYLLIVPLLSLPWTVFLFDGLLQSKKWLAGVNVAAGDRLGRLMRFSFAWILFPLVFFSLSSSKLPGYLLPALPAVVFIVAERLMRLILSRRNNATLPPRQWPMKTTAILCVVFAVIIFSNTWRGNKLSLTLALLLAAPVLAAGCVAFLAARKPALAIFFIATATVFALLVALNVAAPAFAERQTSKRLLQLADARGYSQSPLYGLLRDDRSPEFYAADRVVYEPDGEPTMYEGVGQVVAESRRRQATVLTMARLKDVEQFRQLSSMRVDVIGDNGRVALIAIGPP